MAEPAPLGPGDRVQVHLGSEYWHSDGWFDGTIVRIDPYSAHRRFYWVELDVQVEPRRGGRTNMVSILNPRHIRRA